MVVTRYRKRISGPLLDRVDIQVEVPRVEYEKLSDDRLGERSEAVQARVEAARPCAPTTTCARRKCAASALWTRLDGR